ncbi:MAG: PilZ domain-containing protein [Terracidiphilus sp.]|jgi:hypothetical protein
MIPRAQRFPIHAPLRYRVRGERDWHEGAVKDISSTGLLFRGSHWVELNTEVEISVNLPGHPAGKQGAKVLSRGKIVRTLTSSSLPGTATMAAAISRSRLFRR